MKKTLIAAAVCLTTASAAQAADWGDYLVSPYAKPEGQSYGHWAAEWWQWAIGTPAAVNPVIDSSGKFCAQRQVGKVWFLAGSFGSDPVKRYCKVPAGTSLFFPLINTFYAAYLQDPPEQRTEDFVRSYANCDLPLKNAQLWIDGRKVWANWSKFSTGQRGSQSPLFNIQLPLGSLFEPFDPATNPRPWQLLLSPAAEEGYYVFLKPLAPGNHTISWTAAGCGGNEQHVTYDLKVGG